VTPRSREDDLRGDEAQVPDVTRTTIHNSVKADHPDLRQDISARELEIIELLATGQTNQEIASKLMISKRTVDNHVSNIFTKPVQKTELPYLIGRWIMAKSAAMDLIAAILNLPRPSSDK